RTVTLTYVYGWLQYQSSPGPSNLPLDMAGTHISQVEVLPVYIRIWLAHISVKSGSFRFTSGYGWHQYWSSPGPSSIPLDMAGTHIGQVGVLPVYLWIWLASISVKSRSFRFTSGYGWLLYRSSSGPSGLHPVMSGFDIG